jgi:hypothetical protein
MEEEEGGGENNKHKKNKNKNSKHSEQMCFAVVAKKTRSLFFWFWAHVEAINKRATVAVCREQLLQKRRASHQRRQVGHKEVLAGRLQLICVVDNGVLIPVAPMEKERKERKKTNKKEREMREQKSRKSNERTRDETKKISKEKTKNTRVNENYT